MFDIHRIKPLHGWREFVGEVGIIVVGVLIALTAEQALDSWHWHERVEGGRAAVRRELDDHLEYLLEWRVVQPCIAAQIDALGARLSASGATNTPAPLFSLDARSYTLIVPGRPYQNAAWQGVLAEGVSSHLAAPERFSLSGYYNQAAYVETLNDAIAQNVAQLRSLSRPIALDAGAKLALFQKLDSTSDTSGYIDLIAGQMIRKIGILEPTHDLAALKRSLDSSDTVVFCRAHKLPLRTMTDALHSTS